MKNKVNRALVAKKTTYKIVLGTFALSTLLVSCQEPIPQDQKDWNNSTAYFESSDEAGTNTYYKPSVGSVGDPLPFYDPVENDFKVLYLHNFEQNLEQTFHPLWGVRTTDAATYSPMGEVLPFGRAGEQDAALGTGCVIYDETQKLYYIYYTGERYKPATGEDRQVVMRATSPDFKTWTKDPLFRLRGVEYGYSSVNFRDPYIWKMEDGYHMIVATKPIDSNRIEEKDGCFAEFTSADLITWEHKGKFAKMIWDRFLECPNVFKMGDWWYLTYSDMSNFERKVHYLKATTIEGLKASTSPTWPDYKEGTLDGRAFYAGNTATNGTDRFMWGWCPERRNCDNTDISDVVEPKWGGTLVAHRIMQREDGTLYLAEIPAIRAKYAKDKEVKVVKKWGEEEGNLSINNGVYAMKAYSSVMFSTLGYHNHLSMTVTTADKKDRFGLSFVRGDRVDGDKTYEKYYSLMVCPNGDGSKHFIRLEEEQGVWELKGGASFEFPTPADNTYKIDVYTDNSVLVLYINDVVTYTQRLYHIQRNCWSVNCYEGEATVKDIQIKQY